MHDSVRPPDPPAIAARLGSVLRQISIPLKVLELRRIEIPLLESFQSAIGRRQTRQALLVRWLDDHGSWGIAECSCRPDPYYSAEYVDASILTIEHHIAPKLRKDLKAFELVEVLDRIRGWNFTKAVILDAALDYVRRTTGEGLLETWQPAKQSHVKVGISLGLYSSVQTLIDRIERAQKEGYKRIKLKIRPGLPQNYVEDVRRRFPDLILALDANGSFDWSTRDELLALTEIGPALLEQPFAPDRLDLTREFKNEAPQLRICLDESVHGIGGLRTAWHLRAVDELNLKPGRVGGEHSAILLADWAQRNQLPVWIGGMFETGIGRSANLRLAARCKAAAIHDLSPSSRYFELDLIETPILMNSDGTVPVPQDPPVIREDLIEKASRQVVRLRTQQ